MGALRLSKASGNKRFDLCRESDHLAAQDPGDVLILLGAALIKYRICTCCPPCLVILLKILVKRGQGLECFNLDLGLPIRRLNHVDRNFSIHSFDDFYYDM